MHAVDWTGELGNKWEIRQGVLKRRRRMICQEVEVGRKVGRGKSREGIV